MLFSRKIQQKIAPWLLREEIIVLQGPRQVGKTHLLKLLREDLIKAGIEKERIFFLDLENWNILKRLDESPTNIFTFPPIKGKKNFFLIDEIQNLEYPSHFLKYLYDEHREEIKLIVTGSASFELKVHFQDSLVGRKMPFDVSPLDFEEFLIFKQAGKILDYYRNGQFPPFVVEKLNNYLNEYLRYGGMPKVVLAEKDSEKEAILSAFVSDYVYKDIRYVGRLESVLRFNKLASMLASQIGNLLSINELANTLDLKRPEAELYLNLLENTFVLYLLQPFFNNVRSRLTKTPKVYFFDLGVRNFLIGDFANPLTRSDSGPLFENFVFLELKNKLTGTNLAFYRTLQKAEVDFVFKKDGIIYPVEAKYKNFSRPADMASLKAFCRAQKKECPQGYVVNLNLTEEKDNIKFLPFYSLPQLLVKI